MLKRILLIPLFLFVFAYSSQAEIGIPDSSKTLRSASMTYKDSYFMSLPQSQYYGENVRDAYLFYNDYFFSLVRYSSNNSEFLQIWKLGSTMELLQKIPLNLSGSYYSSSSPIDTNISVYGDYLFVEIPFPAYEFRIFDLSQLPDKLIELNQWDGNSVSSWEVNPFNGTIVNGNYVYRHSYGLKIYDITIPSEPKQVAVLDKYVIHSFKISGNFAYIEFTENNTDKVAIFNIADPKNPIEIGVVEETNASITDYSAKEENLYVLWRNTDNGKATNNYFFKTYSLKEDSTITDSDSYFFSGNYHYYLQLYGDYAYIFPHVVLDISDPAIIFEKSLMKNIPTISNSITAPYYDKNHSGYYIVSPNYCVVFVAYHAQCHLTFDISFINISDPYNFTPNVSFPSPRTFDCGYSYGFEISAISASDKYVAYSSYSESCAIFAGCYKSNYNHIVYKRVFDNALELISFKAKGRKKSVRLKWNMASKAGVVGFRIFRKTKTKSGKFGKVVEMDTSLINCNSGYNTCTFKDNNIKPGKKYRYKLYYKNVLGNLRFIKKRTVSIK